METSDYLREEMALKDVWKSVIEEHGALSVTTTGAILMHKLYVISWDLHKQVCLSEI